MAQDSLLYQPVPLNSGSYELITLLESLRNTGIPLAFSSNKLPGKEVLVDNNESIGNLFKRLQDEEAIRYEISGPLIIITAYVPRKFTVNGVIKDSETGEFLIGANIQVGNGLGTITNGYGYYSITVPEGDYEVKVSHIGYSGYTSEVKLKSNVNLNISIKPTITKLEEVEINSITDDINVISNIPSVTRIKMDEKLRQIPYLLGAVDVIQNALLYPGISTTGEDANGVHIRGGRIDQNLILLDEATIYNPNHYIQVSVFNPDAVNDVKIFKGFIPPSYGGRTSSVIEVRQKEGNDKKLSFSGGIGPFSARALVEGPLRKGKSSFLASVRQSLLNLDVNDFGSNSVRRNRFSFTDVNLKINSKPNKYNTYYLSGYIGNDRNTNGLSSIADWGNTVVNFRWNHIFSPRVFSNLSAYLSEYTIENESSEQPGAFVSTSRIIDYSVKSDLTYSFNPENELNFGFSSILHRLKPGDRVPLDETDETTNTVRLDTEHGLESALYASHQADVGKFRFNYGIRYSMFHNIGPELVRVYEPGKPLSDSTVIDTLFFDNNELVKFYGNLEPRASVTWRLDETSSLKASYSKTAQYLHLISNTLAPAPTDTWKISDTYIPPSVTNQYTLGYYRNYKQNMWESSAEIYYKQNLNNIDYKDGADLIFNENIETELLISRGRAFGLELYLAKKYGKLTGWISYTLSRSETKLDQEEARFVLTNFDKTNDFSTTWIMELSDRLSVSGNFLYSTGIPLTLPSDKYDFEGNLVPFFGQRNISRLPDYHRLDLSLKLEGKRFRKDGTPRKNKSYWVFSLYNVYARRNANSFFYRESETNPGFGEIVQYSIFGTITPGVTYNFKF